VNVGRAATWRGVRLAGLIVVAACAPKAEPLTGVPAPVRALPAAVLPAGRQIVRFHWEYRDREVKVNGDGAARLAPPDSARIDFVVSGGLGSGHALLFGDTIVASGGDIVKRYLPPPPLVWAGLGRLAVPAYPDTTVRIDGDTVRADIAGLLAGHPVVWRVAFSGGRLVGAERVTGDRVRETVQRRATDDVEFDSPSERRTLRLTHVRSESVTDFEPNVWHR
jgi:hypothetical protein